MAAPTTIPSKEPKTAASLKQHKRSRSGCFTCRLRRKKCDEAKPACRACKHLGLRCDYKRPTWWGNSDQRRDQKDYIKNIIKSTQLAKKTAQSLSQSQTMGSATPPGLCHSMSTPEGFSDSVMGSYTHSRAASIDQSPLTSDHSLYTLSPESYFAMTPRHHAAHPPHYSFPSPYDIDVKTERHIFVNDIPTRRDSTISSFSSFQPPPVHSTDHSPVPQDSWSSKPEEFENLKEPLSDDQMGWDFFELPHEQMTPTLDPSVYIDEQDRPLLDHFVDSTSKLLFPVLDATQHGSARAGIVLPALDTNLSFRHCCLSVAGTHKKALEGIQSPESPMTPELDQDIMRHRFATITELCNELNRDENHEQILETTLSMIFFPSCVGSPEDAVLPDIPWHHHLISAKGLIDSLQYPEMLLNGAMGPSGEVPFSMTLFAWIDILGATIRGKSPMLADVYRELNIAKRPIGLQGLMGCDDTLMYLISEIACLEERRLEGMDETMLCKYIEILGNQISMNEGAAAGMQIPSQSRDGSLRPRQLMRNLSVVFRLAARIYLCSMVPGFDPTSASMAGLVQAFVDAMAYIPTGRGGFDRSLAWPLLIAGSVASADSPVKHMFLERYVATENFQDIGSLGRVKDILTDLWPANAVYGGEVGFAPLHWRSVMAQKNWDCLLI
ncbi:fungal-specific transcription factor domain-containing protein [Elsinoe ampelina]|uniref:Fungal-specific transcription factor domain-containing protein n=1 Tax=Elsinoe ampelina TaxID=302913 RepID=A0A6A6GAF9_9PEZI|nr:fungal-specific transcription factor domain-containing protein [Elsinoe ampelina]